METQNHKESGKGMRIGNAQRPRLLTLKDAAQWLGLTVWAMRERCWKGDIPFVKFPGGRKIFIDTQDLDALITQHKTTWK